MRIANQKNFATGLMYTVIGIAFAIGAARYPLGTATRMGPGYFPLGIGVALTLIGLFVLVASLRSHADESTLGSWPVKRLAIILVSVVLFGLLIEPMGLIAAIAALIGVSSLAHREFSARTTVLTILVLVPFTWIIFIWLLKLQFSMLPWFLVN